MRSTLLVILIFGSVNLFAQSNELNYNIIWTTQSKNASESMPCGGGDIGLMYGLRKENCWCMQHAAEVLMKIIT